MLQSKIIVDHRLATRKLLLDEKSDNLLPSSIKTSNCANLCASSTELCAQKKIGEGLIENNEYCKKQPQTLNSKNSESPKFLSTFDHNVTCSNDVSYEAALAKLRLDYPELTEAEIYSGMIPEKPKEIEESKTLYQLLQNEMTDTSQEPYDLIIEEMTEKEFQDFQIRTKKPIKLPPPEKHPDAGTMYGGGRRTAEQNLTHDRTMLRTAELFYEKARLMKQGQAKNKDHLRNSNIHWAYVSAKLNEEGLNATNIRTRFREFRLAALRKVVGNNFTGGERIVLTEAEDYIRWQERHDQGVHGIQTPDVGMIPVPPGQRKTTRISKPHQTFTFPSQERRKRKTPDETPEFDYDYSQMDDTFDSPSSPRPSSSTSRPSRSSTKPPPSYRSSSSSATRPTSNIRSSSTATPSNNIPTSSSARPTRSSSRLASSRQQIVQDDPFQDIFTDEIEDVGAVDQEDEESVDSISDEVQRPPRSQRDRNPSPPLTRTKAKKPKKTGIDKPVSNGPVPQSKRGEFLTNEITKITEMMDRTTSAVRDEANSKMKNNETAAAHAEELMKIKKQQMQYEAESARFKKEKDEAEAARAKFEQLKAEAELKITLLNLEKSQANSNS